MTTHGDREPTWKQKFEILREIFICTKIYDLINNYPFVYTEDFLNNQPYNLKDDIRHAISTCTPSALIQSERS